MPDWAGSARPFFSRSAAPAETETSAAPQPTESGNGWLELEGTWQQISYVQADTQVRYQVDGYMMCGKEHWLHVSFFNRDERRRTSPKRTMGPTK